MAAMRILRLALSSVAAFFASACDNNVVIYYTQQTQPYSIGFVGANVRDGLLAARLYGTAFSARADAETIARAIAFPEWMAPARLTTQPGDPNRDLAVVLVFNPAYKDSGMDVTCRPGNIPQTVAGDGKTLRVAANLCYEGKSISWLYASGPQPSGLDDPKFDQLMSQVMASLLPKSPNL